MDHRSALGVMLLAVTAALSACASTPDTPGSASGAAPLAPAAPAPASPPAPAAQASAGAASVAYREDMDLQKVWLAEGFRFSGYEALLIAETRAEVPRLNPDGRENLEWARGVVRDELVKAIDAKKLFGAVVTRDADLKPGARVLRLENTIVEYEKGGGGARYWAGLYGAGQPVITVRGRVTAGDRQVFVFETRRSGVGGKARWLGAYMSDKDIQTQDIRDLASALAEFMTRPAP